MCALCAHAGRETLAGNRCPKENPFSESSFSIHREFFKAPEKVRATVSDVSPVSSDRPWFGGS